MPTQIMGQIRLVSGPSGSGKSLFCAQQVAAARAAGREVAGILSPGRWADGVKVGIDAVDLRGGATRPLAHLRRAEAAACAADGGVLTQRWRFDPLALAWGNQVLGGSTPCDLLVVDELGPLEWEQGQGWAAGLAAVDSRAFGAALVVVRPSLIPLALARWPDAAVTVLD